MNARAFISSLLTAAMLMAIVADKMGKPINELRFISVREVE